MLHRIFGRSGHGKTKYIFERLSDCIQSGSHAFLIVPEQGAVKTETAVINNLGNRSNQYIEVINFKRLCNRVFRQTGGLASKHLEHGADCLIMSYALDEVSELLTQYAGSASNPDFIKKALESVKELSAAALFPDELDKCAILLKDKPENSELCAKLSDLALIYSSYNDMREKICGVRGDIYDRLCEKLEQSAFFSGKTVFIDGFYGFTAKEFKIISYILEDAEDLYITLPFDGKNRDGIFSRSLHASDTLSKIAERAGKDIKDIYLDENLRHQTDSALYKYCESFSSNSLCCESVSSDSFSGGLETVLCTDIYSEVKAACSITARLIRSGAKFSDICICARNTEAYDGILDAVFKSCGFPLGCDHPEKLTDTALFSLVCAAFETFCSKKSDSILSYVKSGLSGLCELEADMFETYVKTWNLKSTELFSGEEWRMNPAGFTDAPADEQILKIVNSAREKVYVCLDSFKMALKSAKSVKDFALAVWNLLCDIAKMSGTEKFDDKADGLHLDLLCGCLDVMADTVGDKEATAQTFLKLFKLCAEECSTGKIPESLDSVMFSPVSLVRASNVKYMILLGANDGIFPASSAPSGLFTDRERPILYENGIKLSESSETAAFDELFLAYSALCSASKCAFILYSGQDTDGEKLYPSIIVESAQKLTGTEPRIFDEGDPITAFSSDELLFEQCLTLKEGPKRRAAEKYLSETDKFCQKLSAMSTLYTETDTLAPETAALLHSNSLVTSYSRLDKFSQCPFAHFCSYTLRLSPEPKAKLDAMNSGSIMHKILEQFVPIAADAKKKGAPLTRESAHELILRLLSAQFDIITSGCASSITKRFSYMYTRMKRRLFAVCDAILEELEVSKFEMCAFELSILPDSDGTNSLRSAPIRMKNSAELLLSGQIDRVDKYTENGVTYIRIVDYKTGTKSFKEQDVLSGFNLQMLLYMYTVSCSQTKPFGKSTIPAGIMYSKVYDPDESRNLGYDDAELISELTPRAYSDGRFIDNPQIITAMDTTQSGRFIPAKFKDGELTPSDYLLSLENMGRLINYAAEAASELACGIYTGIKKAEPYSDKNLDACSFCDMLPVCQGHSSERKMPDVQKLLTNLYSDS